MLIRTVYASRSVEISAQSLSEILDWSRRVNFELNVTGVLCHLDGVFVQYLEGEEGTVDTLFKSISADTRHKGVLQLERRVISKRMFPDWAMKLLDWNDETRAIFQSFSPGSKLDLYVGDPDTAAPLLRALSRPAGWKFSV